MKWRLKTPRGSWPAPPPPPGVIGLKVQCSFSPFFKNFSRRLWFQYSLRIESSKISIWRFGVQSQRKGWGDQKFKGVQRKNWNHKEINKLIFERKQEKYNQNFEGKIRFTKQRFQLICLNKIYNWFIFKKISINSW